MSTPDLIVESCEFWFVWTKTGHIPRKTHHTEASAIAEADRLARLRPHGKKFIVLRALRKCHVAPDGTRTPNSIPVSARVHSPVTA